MKILGMEYPIITSYPKHANLISILSSHKDYINWLFMNHIQINAQIDEEETLWVGFYQPLTRSHYPLIIKQIIQKDTFLLNNLKICDFIINCIDQNSYVYLMVDTFYISAYPRYEKIHFPHDMFVYGYDKEKEVFYISDFFKSSKYSYSQTSFAELESAFLSLESEGDIGLEGIQVLKLNNDESYTFDLRFCVEMFEDFINGYNSSNRNKMVEEPKNRVFGIRVYQMLMNYLSNYKSDNSVIRALHVIYDHKLLMLERINFMLEKKYLTDINFAIIGKEIEDLSLVLRNSFIKYSYKKNDKTFIGIQSRLNEIMVKEENLYRIIVNELKCKLLER